MKNNINALEISWIQNVEKHLIGRKIVKVKYLSNQEATNIFGDSIRNRCISLLLDNGTWVYPSQDDEENGAGSLFTTCHDLPVIRVL